jgi:hypothetical protein
MTHSLSKEWVFLGYLKAYLTDTDRSSVMRMQFIETDVNTESSALLEAPWACTFAEVEGGWMAFESWTDYEIWQNQI